MKCLSQKYTWLVELHGAQHSVEEDIAMTMLPFQLMPVRPESAHLLPNKYKKK
jgi:hypothetical protein